MTKIRVDPQAIIDRYLAGETMQQIADDYGVSRQRVHQILNGQGVTVADQNAAFDRRIALWHAEGLDTPEIIQRVGRGRHYVEASMRRQGLRANRIGRKPALSPEQVQEGIGLHMTGMKLVEIGAIYGVTATTISKAFIRAGHRSVNRGQGAERPLT